MSSTCPHCQGTGTCISLDDPADFRAWLLSLPQEKPFRPTRRDQHEICIAYLRRRGAADAKLVKGPDGWQHYRCQGRIEETPGWAFYDYGEWDPERPVGEELARWEARMDRDCKGWRDGPPA